MLKILPAVLGLGGKNALDKARSIEYIRFRIILSTESNMAKYSSGILEIVNRVGGHMTAEQVFLEMKRQYPSVVIATVYNNLNTLCAQGVIRRLSVEGQPDRYDRTLRHDHLVCRSCGKLKDVFLGDLTEYLRTETGLEIDSYDLKLSYVCDECRGKARPEGRKEQG